jgi:hypothetical protein
VNDQFCLNPSANAMLAANPVGQWQQATCVVRQPTKTSFDIAAIVI